MNDVKNVTMLKCYDAKMLRCCVLKNINTQQPRLCECRLNSSLVSHEMIKETRDRLPNCLHKIASVYRSIIRHFITITRCCRIQISCEMLSLHHIWKNCRLSVTTRTRIYQTLVQTVLLYYINVKKNCSLYTS